MPRRFHLHNAAADTWMQTNWNKNKTQSMSPSRGCKTQRGSRDATTQKASPFGRGFGLAAGESQFTETSAKSSLFFPSCLFFWECVFPRFYLSGLRPGFGGRGSLKSSRLTPCSTALSPAPRTHGRARSRAHRTWSGEGGGREQEEEEEEMGEARIGGRGDSQTR